MSFRKSWTRQPYIFPWIKPDSQRIAAFYSFVLATYRLACIELPLTCIEHKLAIIFNARWLQVYQQKLCFPKQSVCLYPTPSVLFPSLPIVPGCSNQISGSLPIMVQKSVVYILGTDLILYFNIFSYLFNESPFPCLKFFIMLY